MNVNVTREQAICAFFCEEFNESNKTRLTKRIDEFKDIDICYEKDPRQPILMSLARINSNPFLYHRYICKNISFASASTEEPEQERLNIASDNQIIQFLNEAFLPSNPYNAEVYEHKQTTVEEILSTTGRYTNLLEGKSTLSFIKWCLARNVLFTEVEPTRKARKDNNQRTVRCRFLYVMKEEFLDHIVFAITEYLPRYKLFTQNLKSEGFILVGYVRKSPGDEDIETRTRLLQDMVDKLYDRSQVDKVFVSQMSYSDEPIASRDLQNEVDLVKELKGAEGTTQDLISYIASTDKICLISLDFAGFSTNCIDLKSFIGDNTNLKKIVVDCFSFGKGIKVYDRDELLLENSEALAVFNNRKMLPEI